MAPLSQAAGTPHPLFKARPGLPPSGMYQGLDAMGMPVALEHDTIPAHFGRMAAPAGMQGQTYGGPAMDDPTLELRRHMLRTRCWLLLGSQHVLLQHTRLMTLPLSFYSTLGSWLM